MVKPYVVHWGILGCGGISGSFVRDLVLHPSLRNVDDVIHAVAAVGSRSKAKAEKFIRDNCPEGGAAQKEGLSQVKVAARGSYREVVEDENVQVVYIGTMNTSHYDDAKLVLEGGKHCLLEKPATLNAAEWQSLMDIAKSNKVFLMEAQWTRFNPTMIAVQKALHQDRIIGDVRSIYSDLSINFLGHVEETNRVFNPELAGGMLLDLGPYPMLWAMMLLYRHPNNHRTPPGKIGSTMLLNEKGVDLATQWGMPFPNLNAMANCSVSAFADCQAEHICRIVGSLGEISVLGHTSRPTGYVIRKYIDPSDQWSKLGPDEEHDLTFEVQGLSFEADAVGRCLRDDLLECPEMPHDETLMTMKIFDDIRSQGGYKYQAGLERVQLG